MKKAAAALLLSALILAAAAGLLGASADAPAPERVPLPEYLEAGGAEWFPTGKLGYAVRAMMVSGELSFRNELEETDYTVTDDGVTVVLKGALGEMWASPLPKVAAAYAKSDGSALQPSDFAEKGVFIDLVAIPSRDSHYAMHVPKEVSVTVVTAWGDELHTNLPGAPHGEGDFLVCRAGEEGPDLSDVWVVNGALFPACYDTSRMGGQ